MMNTQKQILTTAALLTLFAVIGAGIVGLTHESTYDVIKRNEQLFTLRKLNTILPATRYDNDLLDDQIELSANPLLSGKPSIAYRAFKHGKPVAVVLSPIAPNGYNGPINMLVGINHDATIAGVRIIRHRETPGLGDAIEAERSDWVQIFNGTSLQNPTEKKWKVKRDGGHFDQFTGATITPRAVVKAVRSALVYFNQNRDKLFMQAKEPVKDASRTDQNS
jgi:electron transport complex protein RnfG